MVDADHGKSVLTSTCKTLFQHLLAYSRVLPLRIQPPETGLAIVLRALASELTSNQLAFKLTINTLIQTQPCTLPMR
jgi:hypothetical protein